jgi:hypothetical protein
MLFTLQDAVGQHEQQLQEVRQQHALYLAGLQARQAELEAKARSDLQEAQLRLSATALTEDELVDIRDKAVEAAQVEAAVAAAAKRVELLHTAMQQVEQEVRQSCHRELIRWCDQLLHTCCAVCFRW